MQAKIFSRARLVSFSALCSLGCSVALAATLDDAAAAAENPPDLQQTLTAPAEPMARRTEVSGFGVPMASHRLDESRGGFDVVKNDMQLSGLVANNSAVNVLTGSNLISDGAFANANGLPTVIQNSGSNVLIQNATIVNVQFK